MGPKSVAIYGHQSDTRAKTSPTEAKQALLVPILQAIRSLERRMPVHRGGSMSSVEEREYAEGYWHGLQDAWAMLFEDIHVNSHDVMHAMRRVAAERDEARTKFKHLVSGERCGE